MPGLPLVADLGLEFHDRNLVRASVRDDRRGNFRTRDLRSPDLRRRPVLVRDEKRVEVELRPFLVLKPFDVEDITRFRQLLLSSGLDDCDM